MQGVITPCNNLQNMDDKRGDLGHLGIDFQYRLAHHLMYDKKFFRDVYDIIDSNMFTEPYLKKFIVGLQEYFHKYDYVPSYEVLLPIQCANSRTDQDLEFISDTFEKIQKTPDEGGDSIKDTAYKFFKQQNLKKVVNQITEIIKIGDIERYDECEDLIRKAITVGNRDEIGIHLRDNLFEVLSDDYRRVVPTGIDGIDNALEGGLGKGEFGIIIGPSGFGKTTITTAMANHAARNGFKVLQIVFEDKEKQIQRKHIGKITGIESKDLSKPENIENVKAIMAETKIFDDNLIIKKFNTGEITVPHLRNYIKRLKNTGFIPDLVIIDYFECLVASKNFKDEWTGEGHTMRQLEALASDLDFALWVPTQGTKDSLNSTIVTMDKAGGSFKKMQIAHIVISIARTIEDIEANVATIAILKNRSGKSGAVMEGIYFNNGTCEINTSQAVVFSDFAEYKESENEKGVALTRNLLANRSQNRVQSKSKVEDF